MQVHSSAGVVAFSSQPSGWHRLFAVGVRTRLRATDRRVGRLPPWGRPRPSISRTPVPLQTALHGPYAGVRRGCGDWWAVRRWELTAASRSPGRWESGGTTAAWIRCRRVDVGIREDMAHGLPEGRNDGRRAGTRLLVRAGRYGSTGCASFWLFPVLLPITLRRPAS